MYSQVQYSTVQCMLMTLQSLTVRALLSLAAELRGRDLDPVLLRRLLVGLGISQWVYTMVSSYATISYILATDNWQLLLTLDTLYT